MESRTMVQMNLVKKGLVDTEGECEGGTNWKSNLDIYTTMCKIDTQWEVAKKLQGVQPGALWWSRGVGGEGGSLGKEYIYIYK